MVDEEGTGRGRVLSCLPGEEEFVLFLLATIVH